MSRLPGIGSVALSLALLAGCSEKRWTCRACLGDAPSTCATSSTTGPTPHRTQEEAQCSAGEELCDTLDEPRFERTCKGKAATKMLGCSKEFLSQLQFTCEAKTHVGIPLVIDL